MPGRTSTFPELVFEAEDDDGAFHVVIEVKPGSGMHTEQQLAREVVDTAHGAPANRIALIAVGADPGVPIDQPQWRAAVDAALLLYGPEGATARVHYSSWAQLGDHIGAVAAAVPALAIYAEDVIAQMRFKGMLGYKGAPVYDDLQGELNIVNAFELVNRAATSARQFFRFLHDTPSFRAIGLESYWNRFEMRRNGTSASLSQDEEWFQVSMYMSAYRKPGWADGAGAFATFYFAADGKDPLLQVGAFTTSWHELLVEYDYSETVDELTDNRLAAYPGPDLAVKAAGENSEWLYDERPWLPPRQQHSDVTWAVRRLEAAATLFE